MGWQDEIDKNHKEQTGFFKEIDMTDYERGQVDLIAKIKEGLDKYIDQCRDILESKGETCPIYVGFEKETYTLTKEEMYKLAKCLYLVDCELIQNKDEENRT